MISVKLISAVWVLVVHVYPNAGYPQGHAYVANVTSTKAACEWTRKDLVRADIGLGQQGHRTVNCVRVTTDFAYDVEE